MDNEKKIIASETEVNEASKAETAYDDSVAAVEIAEDTVKQAVPPQKRSTKWFISVFAIMLIVFFIPMITVGVIVFALPPVYDNTFLGELGEKYDRLNSIDEPKIVIVGGSSVAFGIDSKLMEEKLGMKVVNFGLYANLGTKLMLDLSKSNINEGDIIILAPEMSDQTLSLYFNAETFLQALDGNPSMLKDIDTENYEAIVGASWKFAYEKVNYLIKGTRPENVGAYTKENFNEYGDNVYDRPYNVMTQATNTINLTFRTNFADDKETDYEKYINYVNDYIKFANKKGATVYYSLCPMNVAALGANNNADVIYEYYRNLVNSVNCKVISNINDYLMDEGYFFDSEFHLNNAGVTVRTVKLIDDIKREREIFTQTMPSSELPTPPGFKPADKVEGGIEDNPYYVLEVVDDTKKSGEFYYKIVGLTEEGKKQTKLEIPNNIKNESGEFMPVRVLGANALMGAAIEELTLGQNITAIDGWALNGAMSLKKLIIPDGILPTDISVPNTSSEALITDDECCSDLKIYVDNALYEAFAADYFWGDYGGRLRPKS